MNNRYSSEIKTLIFGTASPSANTNYVLETGGIATFPYRIAKIVETDHEYIEYEIWVVKIPDNLHGQGNVQKAKQYAIDNRENATLLWRKRNPDTVTYFIEGEELV